MLLGRTQSMTDELDEAVSAAAAGDSAALHTIYEALSPRVAGYLSLRGAQDPEALTNDVFVRVLPQISQITGGWRGLRAFVFSVAHGRLVDEFRRHGRRPVHHEYDAEEDPRTSASAEEQALDRVGSGGVLDVLYLLPADQRSVIVLRVLGELTIQETAQAIGRSEAAVKKLQAKALAALRALVSAEAAAGSHETSE
jgi:RNA polymerase sigma-70 factor (ECF subfamily)